jgi:RNase H-fold protein (predicted Holliday junction resolvase)
MSERTVLAIDPGSSKCGMALVRRNRAGSIELLWHSVVSTHEVSVRLPEIAKLAAFSLVIVGGGTSSGQLVSELRTASPGSGLLLVDETNTTMQARERYWEHNRRHGWRRFWPATLQVPPEPVDDFAALILAERVLLES